METLFLVLNPPNHDALLLIALIHLSTSVFWLLLPCPESHLLPHWPQILVIAWWFSPVTFAPGSHLCQSEPFVDTSLDIFINQEGLTWEARVLYWILQTTGANHIHCLTCHMYFPSLLMMMMCYFYNIQSSLIYYISCFHFNLTERCN